MPLLTRLVAVFTPALVVAAFEYVRHRYLISVLPMDVGNWLTAGLAFSASLVIVGSLYSVLERLREEDEERQRRLLVLEERDRIASALHDGICQTLFFANVRLRAAAEALRSGDGEKAAAALAEGRFAVQSAHDDVRQAVFNLRTARPFDGDLAEVLREQLDEFQRQTGIAARLELEGEAPHPEAASQLVQIAREALWNVRKHAGATSVRVRGRRQGDRYVLEVADDGCGFDVQAARRNGRTFGLRIMEERALAAGGELMVESVPGAGTVLRAAVPLQPRATANGARWRRLAGRLAEGESA